MRAALVGQHMFEMGNARVPLQGCAENLTVLQSTSLEWPAADGQKLSLSLAPTFLLSPVQRHNRPISGPKPTDFAHDLK